ncbi:MAG: FtsX-like permease family protein [Dehalococcoidia bacterium]
MRSRKINLLVLRDIMARRFQFAALMVIVALGITIYVCLAVAFGNIRSSYDRTYRETHFADFTVKVKEAPDSVIDEVRGLPNVKWAEGRQVIDSGLLVSEGRLMQARLIGVPSDHRPSVNDVVLESGRYFEAGDRNVVLPVRSFTDFYDLEGGDTIEVYTPEGLQTLRIVGSVSSAEYLILAASKQDIFASPRRFGVFFVPEEELEALFGRQGQINEINVVVESEGEREDTLSSVVGLLEESEVAVQQTVRAEDQPSKAATELDLEGAEEFATLLPALILIVGAFAIYIAMSRLVWAQRTIIGLSRAVGYGAREIVAHYLLMAMVVALAGGVVGIVLGYGLSIVLTNAYASALNIPLVSNRFQAEPIAISVVMSIVVALAAAAIPAWSAARMLPAPAMRPSPEVALARGSVPLIERVMGLGRRPPMLLRLSVRNVWRAPRRTLYTVGAISLGLVLLVVGFSTFDSMNFMMDTLFGKTYRWDIAGMFSSSQSESALLDIRSIEGVESAEPAYFALAEATVGARGSNLQLVALSSGQELHGFDLEGGREAEKSLAEGKLILTKGVADQLHVGVGDSVEIRTEGGSASLEVGGVSTEAMGGLAYVSMETKDGLLGLPAGFNSVFLGTTSPSLDGDVQAGLYRMPDVEGVQIKREIREDFEEVMALFNVMIWFVAAFCLVMSAAIVFNTMTVNVLERERETATMRTLGSSSLSVAAMLVTEGLAFSLLAVAPGLILGTWVSSYLIRAFSSEFFTMSFHMYTGTYVIISVLVVVTALLSTLPSIRYSIRMNLAEATKVLT